MKTFDFEVVLARDTDMTEELVNRLYDAGCDDGLAGVCNGIPVIAFSRDAESLESAIRSAVADVMKTGCTVQRVQIEHDSPLLSVGG